MLKVKTETAKKKDEIKYRSYIFALDLINLIADLPRSKTADILGTQLLRAGTSIGANIIEAQSGSSRRDFINFYHHALKSANETKFWLCLLRDSKSASKPKLEELLNEAGEIAKILGKSLLTLKGK